MTHRETRWIRLLVQDEAENDSAVREERIRLPLDASVSDLLEAMRRTASPLYDDVRLRILRLSGDELGPSKQNRVRFVAGPRPIPGCRGSDVRTK